MRNITLKLSPVRYPHVCRFDSLQTGDIVGTTLARTVTVGDTIYKTTPWTKVGVEVTYPLIGITATSWFIALCDIGHIGEYTNLYPICIEVNEKYHQSTTLIEPGIWQLRRECESNYTRVNSQLPLLRSAAVDLWIDDQLPIRSRVYEQAIRDLSTYYRYPPLSFYADEPRPFWNKFNPRDNVRDLELSVGYPWDHIQRVQLPDSTLSAVEYDVLMDLTSMVSVDDDIVADVFSELPLLTSSEFVSFMTDYLDAGPEWIMEYPVIEVCEDLFIEDDLISLGDLYKRYGISPRLATCQVRPPLPYEIPNVIPVDNFSSIGLALCTGIHRIPTHTLFTQIAVDSLDSINFLEFNNYDYIAGKYTLMQELYKLMHTLVFFLPTPPYVLTLVRNEYDELFVHLTQESMVRSCFIDLTVASLMTQNVCSPIATKYRHQIGQNEAY